MKHFALLLAFSLTMVLIAPLGYASTYTASLSGPNESPPNVSPATGFGTIVLDTTAHTLQVTVTFSGLLGTTTASHIHSPTLVPGVGTAGVATTTPFFAGFPIGVTSGSYTSAVFDTTLATTYNPAFITANGGTTAGAEAALAAGIAAGEAYLNIHTTVVPGGEIRGFLVPLTLTGPAQVPTLSEWVLVGLSVLLMALGFVALRRRQS